MNIIVQEDQQQQQLQQKRGGLGGFAQAIRIDWNQDDYSYRILDDDIDNSYEDENKKNQNDDDVVLFEGGDIAVYIVDKWCVLGQNLVAFHYGDSVRHGQSISLQTSPSPSSSMAYNHRLWNTTIVSVKQKDDTNNTNSSSNSSGNIVEMDPILGPYETPVEIEWVCHVETSTNSMMHVPIIAIIRTYYRSRQGDDNDDANNIDYHHQDIRSQQRNNNHDDKIGYAIVFELQFPNGTPRGKGEDNRYHERRPCTDVVDVSVASLPFHSTTNDTDMDIEIDPDMSMTYFPTFQLQSNVKATTATSSNNKNHHQFSYLSWHGSFVQSVRGLSKGPTGGPTVFYRRRQRQITSQKQRQNDYGDDDDQDVDGYDDESTDDLHVLIGSPWKFNFKAFTAGNNQGWRSSTNKDMSWWAPGTSIRIANGRFGLPKGYNQSIILYEGRPNHGITSTLHEWGQLMQDQHSRSSNDRQHRRHRRHGQEKKNDVLDDITLTHVGYQTDNGAAYCFCKDSNCSKTLIDEIEDLRHGDGGTNHSVPMGYLSFQGAGSSSGRGQAAPWCVETWGVDDGGLDPDRYPISIKDMQKAIDIPLQLYCPYFCPTTKYFNASNNKENEMSSSFTPSNDPHKWAAIASGPSLPDCDGFDFRTITPEQSYDFYGWFMDKGVKVGMKSFETDFMNQNYNCVPDLIESATKGDMLLSGMAAAALERNLSVQLCYATPTDVLASLRMPSVTQFRVSFDFCYGRSWDIGESSMLVWALGAAPSKDTLWTSDNGKFETPGCPWTIDHEDPAAELHLVLALMSTGPVGISDLMGWTNRTILSRAIRSDGLLLKPMKALTVVDRTFLTQFPRGYYLYSTFGIGQSWIFLEFESDESTIHINDDSKSLSSTLHRRDFWPPISRQRTNLTLVYRYFATYQDIENDCADGEDALMSCISGIFQMGEIPNEEKETSYGIRFPLASELNRRRNVSSLSSTSDGAPLPLFVPNLTYVWEACDRSRWVLLGELDKYVPLSPNRFKDFECTYKGLQVYVVGVPNESVKLTALRPQTTILPSSLYTVMSIEIIIPSDGSPVMMELGGDHTLSSPKIKLRR